MPKIFVDDEFKNLLPPLTSEEYAGLRIQLQLYGCKRKLPYWSQGNILLDGHHTREICIAERIPFDFEPMDFPTRELALQWIIDHQLGRRNLTDERKAYYIGKEYLNKRPSQGGPREAKAQNEPLVSTAAKVAEKHGVSAATVKRDAEFANAVDAMPAKEKEEVLSGQSDKSKDEIIKESKKNFCERCTRLGPTKDCTACAAIKPPKKKRKKKTGNEKFDWKKFENDYGKVVRHVDGFAKGYDCKGQTQEKAHDLLGLFHKHMVAWRQRVTKE